jgi:hypothetical protein
MTKRAKILVATMTAALMVGGFAPSAFAKSVGQRAHDQVTNVTDGTAGRVVFRVVQRAMDTAF